MPRLLSLTCQTCGSNEITPTENGLYRCEYCQTNHILVDESLQRTQELNTFFGAAAVFMELRQYDRALYTFNRILNDSPGQSRAYWGLVICQSDRFTRIEITQKEFKEISDNAKCAIAFAPPEELKIIRKLWDNYSSSVEAYYQEQLDKKEAEIQRQEAQRQAEEKTQKDRRAKEQQLKTFMDSTRKAMDLKETKIKTILLIITISGFVIINIIYCAVVFSQNIPGSINKSPACIAPVVVGGLIAMTVSSITSGLFRARGLSCIPAIINAVCVIMMIGGMLSHSSGFFISVMVVICFGAIGTGVTALLGWLGNLIAGSISKDSSLFDYAKNKCNNEYEKLVNTKRQELGL